MSKPFQTLILSILILLLAGLFFGVPFTLIKIANQTADRVAQPFSQANQQILAIQTAVTDFMHPTPTILPDPVTIIHEVRSLARLETIQYSVEKVITAETGQGQFGFLFGDRLLFVAHGIVIAGIDLGDITSKDFDVKDGALHVHLPEPEVFITTLDNDQSYVYDRETGLFTKGNTNLESEARKVAEQEIEQAAIHDGILENARGNAETYLERLLNTLGYPEVIFEFDESRK